MQNIANQLPDAFTDLKRITKSHIPAENAPIRIDVPEGQPKIANETKPRLKRGRPIGSKDKNPRKKKGANNQDGQVEEADVLGETQDITNQKTPEEVQVPENYEEISISYVTTGKRWNRENTVVDNAFSYNVALEIIDHGEDHEPKTVEECRHRNDWPKWKDAIQVELNSLSKREVFELVVQIPKGIKLVGYMGFCAKTK